MKRVASLAALVAIFVFLVWGFLPSQGSVENRKQTPSNVAERFAGQGETDATPGPMVESGVVGNEGMALGAQASSEAGTARLAVHATSPTGGEDASIGTEQRHTEVVEFLATDSMESDVRWWRLEEDGDASSDGRVVLTGGVGHGQLTPGHYLAGLVDTRTTGQLVEFDVLDAAVEVLLPPWTLFPVSFQVLNAYTQAPVAGASISFRRAGAGGKLLEEASRTKVSDSSGMVRFEDLVPAEWVLSSECAGYVSDEYTVELPGRWADRLAATGAVDIETFTIAPVTTVPFALVGGEPFEDLTAYAISHTHEGEKVHFDAEGRADLALGWYDEPLYIKVWYPDGRAAILYLEGGLPPDGKAHEIEIGGPRELEVDLRFTEEVKELIEAEENGGLRVSFRPRTGDAAFVGVETKSEGSFIFDDVQAETAVVNFATASEGSLPVDWKTILVELAPKGTTTCSLVVDQRPLSLFFQGRGGAPLPGYTFEVRQLPNSTSWLAGGVSDEAGRAPCVRVTGRPASLFGRIQDTTEKMAIDLPLDMGQARETVVIDLADREPTFLEVQLGGLPQPGVEFILTGRDTGVAFLEVRSGENGQTKPTDLLRKSRADAVLASENYWMPASAVELQPGRNLVHVFEMGTIKVRDPEQLQRLTHASLGTSPATWLARSLLRQSDLSTGLLRVPAGRYLVDRGQSMERSFLVAPGESVDSGL